MWNPPKITNFLIVFLLIITAGTTWCSTEEQNLVEVARAMLAQTRNWVRVESSMSRVHGVSGHVGYGNGFALRECDGLYDESEARLSSLVDGRWWEGNYTVDDARTWLSGVLANHRTCLDGLEEMGLVGLGDSTVARNFTSVIEKALGLYSSKARRGGRRIGKAEKAGALGTWKSISSKADMVVAKDGSGTFTTINQALSAVSRMGLKRSNRVIIHVKSGVYNEKVEIGRNMKNIMLVGDGIDRTIVTGSRNVPDGATTYGSATFGVSGDGFWARDMTFENTAGPHKHQAVALRVNSDHSVFYRCSFKGYQDTLFVHSLRQFYRDCHIYGTIDFIFGDAAAIFQNCDIFVRRPMEHQGNMITAQGRDNPNENTGICIQESRVRPAADLEPVKRSFRTYLGRPWKKYSRTIFLKTDLDGFVDPKGWREWSGSFGLSTLYYAEYMNTGEGASVEKRVNWPGFHVLTSPQQAVPFTVTSFIQGDSWIPPTGIPFSSGI